MHMDTKGFVTVDAASYLWKIFTALVVLICFVLLVSSRVDTDVDIGLTESEVIYYRLLYTPQGISYFDSVTETVYPAMIDMETMKRLKTDPEYLSELVQYKDKTHLGIKYSLYEYEFTGQGPVRNFITSFYFNQQAYDKLRPLSKGNGPGASTLTMHKMYVTIHNKKTLEEYKTSTQYPSSYPEDLVPGMLEAEVVVQSS